MADPQNAMKYVQQMQADEKALIERDQADLVAVDDHLDVAWRLFNQRRSTPRCSAERCSF